MTSYVSLLNKIETFCNAHLQIKKYGGEFREQMPNFATKDEKYPIIFIVPTGVTPADNTQDFTFDIYCFDIIQKDRANIITILSDTQQILNDLYVYFTYSNDHSFDVVGLPVFIPMNNDLLDYAAGYQMSITLTVNDWTDCQVPLL